MIKIDKKVKPIIGLSIANILNDSVYKVPSVIFNIIKRETTTTLTIRDGDKVFYDTMDWIGKKYKDRNFRQIRLCNDWNEGKQRLIASLGYGNHILKYKNTLLLIRYYREEREDLLAITTLGRSRKTLDKFIEEATRSGNDTSKTDIYKMQSSEWDFIKKQPKRRMGSVFIEKYKKDMVLNALKRFKTREKWYLDNGIPYQLGILLYGPPGCGKTSFIKAIAAYLNYPIYYLPVDYLFAIEKSMNSLPDKSLLVIEDIDCNVTTHSRDDDDEPQNIRAKPVNTKSVVQEIKEMSSSASTNLSAILNSIDGIMSTHGRILIATTNHIEKLDDALIRPGRIDLKIEVGYINKETIQQFMDNYFPNDGIDYDLFEVKDNLTISTMQEYILQDKTSKEIIDLIKK